MNFILMLRKCRISLLIVIIALFIILSMHILIQLTTFSDTILNENKINGKTKSKTEWEPNITIEDSSKRTKQLTRVYGPGELGSAVDINVSLLSPEDRLKYEDGLKKHQMNEYVSDLISVHRTLDPDIIPSGCKNITYDDDLGPCAIIIVFRNEAWSTLIRLIHSILDRTPHDMIDEILLVDDGSIADHLKYRLELYISFLPKVRIIRIPKSVGAICAQQKGVDCVKAKYFAILDSHCEVAEGWLQPLLQRLKENPKLFVTPRVGNIYHENFYYYIPRNENLYSWSFDFYLYQQMSPYREEYVQSLKPNAPIRLAGHQANAFVAEKEFFMQLGGYDTGMKVWGGDMMELMFKYVMCGGDMEMLPCSNVGHVYRSSVIWKEELLKLDISNSYRVAEVWMDEYKHLVFERDGNYTFKTGDVEKRRKIRQNNNCKPFQYFLDHVKEIVHLYVPVNLGASGAMVNLGRNLCFSYHHSKLVLNACHWQGYLQFWEWSEDKEIRQGMKCLVPTKAGSVDMTNCNFKTYVQWEYSKVLYTN